MKLAVVLIFFGLCFAENDIYSGGNFLLTLEQENGNLAHVASLVTYIPDDDAYEDTFGGGVFLNTGFVNLLAETPLGTYGSGVFRFVGDSFAYCNSVLRYNSDDDEFESLGNGIFLRNSEAINYISGTKDYTYFAGVFTSVEDLAHSDDADSTDEGTVPNIVRIDKDDNWSRLDNSDNIFPAVPIISGLTSNNDDTIFIYASSKGTNGTLYSYQDDQGYTTLSQIALSGKQIVSDNDGNIVGYSFSGNSPSGSSGTYSLIFLSSDDSYSSPTVRDLYTINGNECENGTVTPTPLIINWNEGFLIAIPDVSTGCSEVAWRYFETANQTLTTPSLPPAVDVDLLVNGDDNDIWIASHSSSSLYYLPTGASQWTEVSLSSYGTFTVYAMTWENGPNKLLVFGTTETGKKLIQLSTEAMPPIPEKQNPGVLSNPGIVRSLVVMNDPDDDDYELYIGGTFDDISSGHTIGNLAKYKQGDVGRVIENIGPIAVLATSGSTLFYANTECVKNNENLPIGYYSKDAEEVWIESPILIGGAGCVTAMFADESYIFIGGSFTVSIPGSNTQAHAVVYFDKEKGEWKDIGIPNTIGSSGVSYDINSLSVSSVNGTYYLAIGGHFDFTVDGFTYHSFAVSDVTSRQWYNSPPEFATDSIVNEVLIDDISRIYIAGSLELVNQGSEVGVFYFNLNDNTYSVVGNLPTEADSIILYNFSQDDVDYTNIIAGGNFNNGTLHSGLGFTDVNSSPLTPWTRAAPSSQFNQFYTGDITSLVYTTGGIGSNDTNGYDSSYATPQSSSSGGMSGWGVFFLTVFILLIVVVIVAAVVGGGFAYMRKRNNYQAV